MYNVQREPPQYILHAGWSSSTYPNIHGVCEFKIFRPVRNNDNNDQFSAEAVFQYAIDSQFRAGKKHIVELLCARRGVGDSSRIIAQSLLKSSHHSRQSDHQLLFTFSFDKPVVTGYYASVVPIDCGALKTVEPKSQWREAFGIDI